MILSKEREDIVFRHAIDHGKVVEEEILVKRGPKHPDGPGYSAISTFTTKKEKKK
jgi:hypothetical protein